MSGESDGSPAVGMYEQRTYRHWVSGQDLVSFTVAVRQTDLLIRADRNLRSRALAETQRCRASLEQYIESHPVFAVALVPVPVEEDAPALVKKMADAARLAGVGPMASVAGAIAESVGRELLRSCNEVIVENGGDIFLRTTRERLIGVYAGESPLTGRIAFAIRPDETPVGVCTSSASVGPSLSFGNTDAVTVFSPSASLADAAATAIGNRVHSAGDIAAAIEFAQTIEGVRGVAIVLGDQLGLWGQIRLAEA